MEGNRRVDKSSEYDGACSALQTDSSSIDVGAYRKVQTMVMDLRSPNIYMVIECEVFRVPQGTSAY